jgi:hypothetical protein
MNMYIQARLVGVGKERDALQQLLRTLEVENKDNVRKYKVKPQPPFNTCLEPF